MAVVLASAQMMGRLLEQFRECPAASMMPRRSQCHGILSTSLWPSLPVVVHVSVYAFVHEFPVEIARFLAASSHCCGHLWDWCIAIKNHQHDLDAAVRYEMRDSYEDSAQMQREEYEAWDERNHDTDDEFDEWHALTSPRSPLSQSS